MMGLFCCKNGYGFVVIDVVAVLIHSRSPCHCLLSLPTHPWPNALLLPATLRSALSDFDDLVFQTARDYSSLDDAKSAAIMAVATLKA